MKAQATGTLIDGVVQLDQPVNLPNNSRVNVSIEPMSIEPAVAKAALEAFKTRLQQRTDSFRWTTLHAGRTP